MSSLLTMRRAGQAHPAYKTKPFQLGDFTENGLNHMSATPRQACLMIERRQENVGVGDVRCKYRTSRVSMARCVAESWEPRSTSSKLYHRPTSPPRLEGISMTWYANQEEAPYAAPSSRNGSQKAESYGFPLHQRRPILTPRHDASLRMRSAQSQISVC